MQQLTTKGIEVFLPTVTRWSQWKDRRKKIDWPLFPGYCFAHFDSTQLLPILACNGVLNVVSFGGKPEPVSDLELESLRLLVRNNLQYDPFPLVSEGTKVEVIQGPLSGVVGRLLRKDTNHATVILSVELIGQAARVQVDATHIRPF